MGLMSWLQKALAGDATQELSGHENEVRSGLNLKQTLDVHAAWKQRLQNVIDGMSLEQLDVATVAQDDLCVLGKWIYGDGRVHYGHLPEYEVLRQAHSQFHLCAGEVLAKSQSGNLVDAAKLLKGEFRTASNNNQLELVRLFAVIK